MKSSFYATFGTSDKRSGHVVKIQAESRREAETKMFDAYGTKWAFLYSDLSKVDPGDKARGILETLT